MKLILFLIEFYSSSAKALGFIKTNTVIKLQLTKFVRAVSISECEGIAL